MKINFVNTWTNLKFLKSIYILPVFSYGEWFDERKSGYTDGNCIYIGWLIFLIIIELNAHNKFK